MNARKNIKKRHPFSNSTVLFLSVGFLMMGALLLWVGSLRMPDFTSFEERKVAQSTKIYDATGKIILYDIHQDIKRTVVPFGDISRYLKNATVAIEDAEFYQHYGIKPKAILRAIVVNLGSFGFSQGGSTITQQVIKNSLLTQEKTISRKLKEWALAVKLERVMSKEDILTLYLNEAPYGGNIYGAEEASRAFFGKSVKDITLAEAAYLAALPQAPTFYSPYGNNKEGLTERKNLVLKRMRELGFISEEEMITALAETVEFIPQEERGIKAAHFVFFIRSYLEKKYGKDLVEEGGLRVITTLRYDLQKKAEEIIEQHVKENTKQFNASNAGMVALDPKTGQILVMVGSRNYFDKEIDGNFNVTLSPRQPGSAFKPFVYATAFKKGYTPDTVVFDLPTQFQTTCDPEGRPLSSDINPDDCYMPTNYDGIYRGPMSLRDALAQSVNIPALKTLYLAGLSDSLQTAKDFGITSLTNTNRYGLTLVLGGGEVSLLEMTNAYGVFANEGVRNPYSGILRIEDKNGNVLEEFEPKPQRVISDDITLQISDILSDNTARTPAFGARSYLYIESNDVAVKTGTTNDYKDAWILGYTPSLVVGTWAGNNDNTSMEKKVAGFIVAPMWNAFMQEILKEYPKEEFRKPPKTSEDIKPILRGVWQGGEQYIIDRISGKLATEYTPKETQEKRVLTNVHNILYWVNKNDPLGANPTEPEKDPQFNLWEYSVRKWVARQNIQQETADKIPKEFDDVHKPEFFPKITIIEPNTETLYAIDKRITVTPQNNSPYPLSKVDFFVNGVFIGTSTNSPFTLSFMPSDLGIIKNQNQITVVGYDTVFNKGEAQTVFNIK